MKIATRRRLTRLYNNAGPWLAASGAACLALAILLGPGRF